MAEKKKADRTMVSYKFEPTVLKAIEEAQQIFQKKEKHSLSKSQVVSTLILRGVEELKSA